MSNFKVKEIEVQHPMFDEGDVTIRITCIVYGKRRRYTARGCEVEQAIVDCYFFHTGKVALPPDDKESRFDWEFTEENANPDDFSHLEGVPEYLSLPF
jgi:hypothetical protein